MHASPSTAYFFTVPVTLLFPVLCGFGRRSFGGLVLLILFLLGLTIFSAVLFIDPAEFHAIRWFFLGMTATGALALWGLIKQLIDAIRSNRRDERSAAH